MGALPFRQRRRGIGARALENIAKMLGMAPRELPDFTELAQLAECVGARGVCLLYTSDAADE